MNLFEEAKQTMQEISQEADFFTKARKKRRQVGQGDYSFVGTVEASWLFACGPPLSGLAKSGRSWKGSHAILV